jgi:hypothetical protein
LLHYLSPRFILAHRCLVLVCPPPFITNITTALQS